MAFDENYYKEKKQELANRIQKKKDNLIREMITLMDNFLVDQKEAEKDWQDITKHEETSQNLTAQENKAKIDKVIKK